ncbi:MAG: hypothetical protein R3C45_20745 [Phycisphaerales bacterium]
MTELALEYANIIGPDADKLGTLTETREFNLMFETYVAIRQRRCWPTSARNRAGHLSELQERAGHHARVKVPFGIGADRQELPQREITPRNFFRSREFEQMEMEWFCSPEEAAKSGTSSGKTNV